MSKTCLYTHIVFATKKRVPAISMFHCKSLYYYIIGIINNKGCVAKKIGGVMDHIHILVDMNPTVAVADLVKTIKQSSSLWLKDNPDFPKFQSWQKGYFAGSVGPDGLDRCCRYIENQEQHHLGDGFRAEIEWMLHKYNLQMYEDDWV